MRRGVSSMWCKMFTKRRFTKKRIPIPETESPSHYFVVVGKHLAWLSGLLAFILLVWWLTLGGAISVQSIDCETEAGSCSAEILAELERFRGSPLLLLRSQEISQKLKEFDPTIKQVVVTTKLPSHLNVRIASRQTLAAITIKGSDMALLADEDGFIFSKRQLQDQQFPIIYFPKADGLNVGEQITDESLLQSIALAKLLEEHFISYRSMMVEDGSLRCVISDQLIVLFSHDGNLSEEVTSLQRILSEVTMSSTPVTIDVRHEKPVVVFDEAI